MAKPKGKKVARPPRKAKVVLEFAAIAQRCNDKLEATDQSSVQVQWMKMILDCCRFAKEEQRLLDGIGVGAEYKLVIQPPEPKAIPDDEVPQKANQDESEGGGKVVH